MMQSPCERNDPRAQALYFWGFERGLCGPKGIFVVYRDEAGKVSLRPRVDGVRATVEVVDARRG